ncbi:MAG: tetratricopeptide repeat protein [Bacilli bacterium]
MKKILKKNVIENLLNNTDISSLELEEYLNLKFTDGINYNFSLNKLAKENNTYALYEMGTDEYYGYIKGYPRYDISFDYFRRASYKNHPGSFYMMAKLYINGFVGSKSNDELKEAFKYLNTAIEYGNVAAINAMGLLYLNGTYPVKKRY